MPVIDLHWITFIFFLFLLRLFVPVVATASCGCGLITYPLALFCLCSFIELFITIFTVFTFQYQQQKNNVMLISLLVQYKQNGPNVFDPNVGHALQKCSTSHWYVWMENKQQNFMRTFLNATQNGNVSTRCSRNGFYTQNILSAMNWWLCATRLKNPPHTNSR